MTTAPLLALFAELRRRNLLLGVSEYLAALEALARGFGTGSREELCWMCQALWSKSPEESEQIAESLELVLPAKVTPEQLDKLTQEAQRTLEEQSQSAGLDNRPGEAPADSELKPQDEKTPETSRMELSQVASSSADSPLLARAAESIRRSGSKFDLVGELPVPRRYIKRAWRYLRRMQRLGPAVELDVEATAIRRYSEGVLVAPVLVPRRRNLASVLVLVDEGGSMTPFRQITSALIDAARQGGFARADIYYFHDLIGESVYREPFLRTPVALSEALRPFAAALIISDAGAARRQLDRLRALRTKRILEVIRRQTPRIVWLNPVPRTRWPATTAEAIGKTAEVAMYPFTRQGLDAAMDILRGRTS